MADELHENGGEEDENIDYYQLQQGYKYSMGVIQLPDLDLDSSDDSDEELEPFVNHPVLDQGKFAIEEYSSLSADDTDIVPVIPSERSLSTGTNDSTTSAFSVYDPDEESEDTSTTSTVDIACGKNDVISPTHTGNDQYDVISPTHAGNDQYDAEITKLMGADLADMELDNAILSLVPSHSLNVRSLSRGSSVNLSDSSGSGSSLLGKLEETMSSLKEANELENHHVEERLVELHTKTMAEGTTNDARETVTLDLRHHHGNGDVDDDGRICIPTNQSVLLRYGRIFHLDAC